MRKINISIPVLAIALALVTSCSNEDYLAGNVDRSNEGVTMNTVTASMGSTVTKQWNEGDAIAVSSSYYDLTSTNRKFICGADGTTFTMTPLSDTDGFYVKNTQEANVVAYYPFEGDEQVDSVKTLNACNQTTLNDYLIARVPVTKATVDGVHFVFQRALGDLVFNITHPTGEKVNKIRLSDAYTSAIMNTRTLNLALASADNITGKSNDSDEDIQVLIENVDETTQRVKLLMIPQSITADDNSHNVTLQAITSNSTYNFYLTKTQFENNDFIITAGGMTTYTIDLSKGITNIEFSGGNAQKPVEWGYGDSEDIHSN